MRLHQAGTEGSASKDHEALEQKRVRDSQRVPPDRQSVQQFDQLLREGAGAQAEAETQPFGAKQQAESALDAEAIRKRAQTKTTMGLDAMPQELPPALLVMIAQNNPQLHQAQQNQAAAHTGSQRAQDVMEMLRKHVRQLAISSEVRDLGAGGKGWLRLNESLLPGTEILLERDARGWRVHARTDSQDAQTLMESCASALQAHFDEAGLGAVALRCELRS